MQNKIDSLKSFNQNFGNRSVNTQLSNSQLFAKLQNDGNKNTLIPGVNKQLAEFILIILIIIIAYFGNIISSMVFFNLLTAMTPLIVKMYILEMVKIPATFSKHTETIKVIMHYLIIYIIACYSINVIILKECVQTAIICNYTQLTSIVAICGLLVPLFSFLGATACCSESGDYSH